MINFLFFVSTNTLNTLFFFVLIDRRERNADELYVNTEKTNEEERKIYIEINRHDI